MTMDDTFAFYGGKSSTVEDVVVKGFVNYTYTCVAGHRLRRRARTSGTCASRTCTSSPTRTSSPCGFSSRPRTLPARDTPPAQKSSDGIVSRRLQVRQLPPSRTTAATSTSTAARTPLTNFVFENCTFGHPTRPAQIMGAERRAHPVQERQDERRGGAQRRAAQARRLRVLRPSHRQIRAVTDLPYASARFRLSMASSISCVLLKPTVTQSTPAFWKAKRMAAWRSSLLREGRRRR